MLDAADRIAAAPEDGDLALVIPAGAPLARSGVLLAVAHRLAGNRPFAIVSGDPRARAVAAGAHVRAYASLGALDREELDPTEREHPIMPATTAGPRITRTRDWTAGLGRRLAATASFVAAALVATAVALPSATIAVAPATAPVGPLEFTLRAGPGGDFEAQQFGDKVSANVPGTATGKKTVETKATGVVRFTNKTTSDIALPRGTLVRSGNTRFLTTEAKSLPRSILVPFLLSSVDAAIEAVDPGRSGNVAAGAITSSDPARYDATNPQATTGGDSRSVSIVTQADYDGALKGVDATLKPAIDAQVAKWRGQLKQGYAFVGAPLARLTSQVGAAELVGKELEKFEVPIAASVLAFAVSNAQPRDAAIARLRTAVEAGNDIDPAGAAVDLLAAPAISDNGVTYRIRAQARQFARPNSAALRATLAGRAPSEAEAILRERGLRLVDVSRFPEWWPRLPLLDARIRIVEQTQQ